MKKPISIGLCVSKFLVAIQPFLEKSNTIWREMAILLNMPIKSFDGDIARIVKESLVKCEHMSSLILIFNGVLNRLLPMFQLACMNVLLINWI